MKSSDILQSTRAGGVCPEAWLAAHICSLLDPGRQSGGPQCWWTMRTKSWSGRRRRMLCSAPLAQSEVYLGRGRADVTERLRGSLLDKKPLPCLVCGLAYRDNNAQQVWIRDRQCAVDSLVGSIVQCGLPTLGASQPLTATTFGAANNPPAALGWVHARCLFCDTNCVVPEQALVRVSKPQSCAGGYTRVEHNAVWCRVSRVSPKQMAGRTALRCIECSPPSSSPQTSFVYLLSRAPVRIPATHPPSHQ